MGPRKPPAPLEPVPARLSAEDIRRGVLKLHRRIEEVKALDPANVAYNDQRVENAESNIRNTILEVFGAASPQYQQHKYLQISKGTGKVGQGPEEFQRQFADGIPETISLLQNLVANLEEQQDEQQTDPAARARTAFAGLDLHPRIRDVSEELYRDGHYRNAILDSAVALVNYVKEKSRRHDLDGAPLMRAVFSRNSPVLAFNNLADQSDLDEQEGLMHLFEGAVLAFRNPRAHDLAPDTPEYALECVGFLSMLAKKVDGAQRRARSTGT